MHDERERLYATASQSGRRCRNLQSQEDTGKDVHAAGTSEL